MDTTKKKILAIGSHADDIELGCGGTIKSAINKGHEVLMITMAGDGYAHHDGHLMRSDEVTVSEAQNAADFLGAKLMLFHFPSKDIPYDSKTVGAIEQVMTDFNPDYIFTQWVFDTHQDHRNTSLATISAARNFENIFLYEPFPPSGRSYVGFKPQVYVDITDTIDDKVKSIEYHVSQVEKYGSEWTESIRGRAKLRGFESGVKYAETFELLRFKLSL